MSILIANSPTNGIFSADIGNVVKFYISTLVNLKRLEVEEQTITSKNFVRHAHNLADSSNDLALYLDAHITFSKPFIEIGPDCDRCSMRFLIEPENYKMHTISVDAISATSNINELHRQWCDATLEVILSDRDTTYIKTVLESCKPFDKITGKII